MIVKRSNVLFKICLTLTFLSTAFIPEVNVQYIIGFLVIPIVAFTYFIKIDFIFKVNFFLLLLYTIGQFIGLYYTSINGFKTNYITPILIPYFIILGYFSYVVGYNTLFSERVVIYRNIFILFIFYLFFDFLLRLINFNPAKEFIYMFKHGGVHYDSNFTGIVIVVVFSYYLFLEKIDIYRLSIWGKLLLFILTILTFSRSSIAIYIVMYVLSKIKTSTLNRVFPTILFVLFFMFVYLVNDYFLGDNFSDLDGSFNARFYILQKIYDVYTSLQLEQRIFGIGVGNTEEYIGIFAHNIVGTLILEFGWFGVFVIFLYYYMLYKRTCGYIMYVFLPTLLIGFSLFSAYIPFLFILGNLVYLEVNESNKRRLHV